MVQPKRPASALESDSSPANGQNWKKRKQERAHSARFIHAQASKSSPSSSTVNSALSSSNASHTGSLEYGIQTANSALPSSLEVEAIISSRAFQIQSFLRSIKSAKSATTTRAWQLLPRHARRRAASHNLLRLPSRLRGKALAELKSSTTRARTRSETRKRMPDHGIMRATLRRQKLAHRASHPKRRWLETHMWHAKRFRMTTEKGKGKEKAQGSEHGRWGFVIPETTMMKSHKASWRSALEYVTVHDASYQSVFRLGVLRSTATLGEGELRSELTSLLHRCGAGSPNLFTSSPRTKLVFDTVLRSGKTDSLIHDGGQQSCFTALAPVRVVFLPQAESFSNDEGNYSRQEAFIFVHPAGELYVRRALKSAGCILKDEKTAVTRMQTLNKSEAYTYAYQLSSAPDAWIAAGGKDRATSRLEKRKRRQMFDAGSAKISAGIKGEHFADEGLSQAGELERLRRKQGYNVFEIVGPKASTLLTSLLKLDEHRNPEPTKVAFHHLLTSRDAESDKGSPRPDTSLVALEVHDPRLSYPPRLKPIPSLCPDVEQRCSPSHANSRLLSFGASGPYFSKGEIDSRRAKNSVPGSRLEPDPRDDIVPVVLIKQNLVGKPLVDSFTLIVPRGWGMAFFMSLVASHQSGASSGARVIGQHQLRHQKLELSALAASHDGFNYGAMLSYPFNWPGTLAYARSDKDAISARLEQWAKRPKGKRTEFKWPTSSDWCTYSDQQDLVQLRRQLILLSQDRTGAARPFPFGGPEAFKWIAKNSQTLYGPSVTGTSHPPEQSWLIASPKLDAQTLSSIEISLAASAVASALVPLRLQAVRKGTISSQSSLLLAPTYADHFSWVHHLESTNHPSLIANRMSSKKMDKKHLQALIERRLDIMQLGRSAPKNAPGALDTQLAIREKRAAADVWSQYLETAPDPELLHNSSADWNHTIGLVLDGEYSLGSGRGFGIGAVSMRAWRELLNRQAKLETEHKPRAGRTPRNPTTTTHLLLMREPGTDVLRAITASFIPL